MGLKAIVAFAFAHIIAFALGVWCLIETEHQNASEQGRASLALKILLVYDALLLLCFAGILIVKLLIKKRTNIYNQSSTSSSSSSSLDLEEK
jgi:hypothetical protein